jgi:hypothetical protein
MNINYSIILNNTHSNEDLDGNNIIKELKEEEISTSLNMTLLLSSL